MKARQLLNGSTQKLTLFLSISTFSLSLATYTNNYAFAYERVNSHLRLLEGFSESTKKSCSDSNNPLCQAYLEGLRKQLSESKGAIHSERASLHPNAYRDLTGRIRAVEAQLAISSI